MARRVAFSAASRMSPAAQREGESYIGERFENFISVVDSTVNADAGEAQGLNRSSLDNSASASYRRLADAAFRDHGRRSAVIETFAVQVSDSGVIPAHQIFDCAVVLSQQALEVMPVVSGSSPDGPESGRLWRLVAHPAFSLESECRRHPNAPARCRTTGVGEYLVCGLSS